MINKTDFEQLQQELRSFEEAREKVISKSREVVKLSKQIIYATHRNDLHHAEKLRPAIKKELASLQKMAAPHPGLHSSGSVTMAEQEFVEAICFLDAVKNGNLTPHGQLEVSTESYLLGLCDLTGELLRRGINASIKENYTETVAVKDLVGSIYDELMQFDFRNGDIRRKFDSIKYALSKLEDVVLELKLKGKV